MVEPADGDDVRTGGPSPASVAERAWALMRQYVDSHSRHGDVKEALGFSLGGGRGKVLFQLRCRPQTLRQLADANGFDAPYATLVVDKLEAHGLVERGPHPGDRRRKLVTLTAAGQAAVATAEAILFRPPPAVSTLRANELQLLIDLLRRLIDSDEPDES